LGITNERTFYRENVNWRDVQWAMDVFFYSRKYEKLSLFV